MGEVGDGSMSSPPKIQYLPLTENEDGSMGVDLSDLLSSENPETVSASVNLVASHCRRKNKELWVKVPRECFNFIAPLAQMGFTIIEHAESTHIVLKEDKSLQIASGVTLMQRETIANFNNLGNLIDSYTPEDATLAVVQTPSQTACEQGPEFQHSSQAFASSATGSTRNGNEAVGLRRFSGGPEIAECGVQTKKRSHPEKKTKLLPRFRGPDFEDEEKGLLLQLKLEYLQDPANERKRHKWSTFVSHNMSKNGRVREPKAVQGQWDSFKKRRDALMRKWPQGTGYWDMTMDEKKAYKKDHDHHFPLTFKLEWVDTMEKIESIESVIKKQTRRDGQEGVFSQPLPSAITGSTNSAGTGSSDGDPRENSQRAVASFVDLSFLHSPREKDNQKSYVSKQDELRLLSASEIFCSDSINASDLDLDLSSDLSRDWDKFLCAPDDILFPKWEY